MCGIEIRHCQIYKAAKILPLMHIFSGSGWRMCFTKMGGLRGHGIQKKKGNSPKEYPQENYKEKCQGWSKKAEGSNKRQY